MRTKILFACLGLSLFLSVTFLSGCKKDKEDAARNNISGIVRDENGSPVENAEVSVDGKTDITDASGEYFIENLSGASKYQVTVNAEGYFTGYKNAENIDDSEIYADVMLLFKQPIGSLDGQTGGTISGPGISYTAEPNAFTRNGVPYTGPVEVSTRYVEASSMDLISEAMPGGDFSATDANGQDGSMISFGFFATEFSTPSGERLNVNPGTVNAGISVPGSVPSPSANDASAWVFNPTSGNWNSTGNAVNNGNEYFLPVTSQVFCNLDKFSGKAEIYGRVVDCEGKGLGGVEVVISNSLTRYKTRTNGNGYYKVEVAAPQSLTIAALGQTINTGNISPNTRYNASNITQPCAPPMGSGTGSVGSIQESGNIAVCGTPNPGNNSTQSQFVTQSGNSYIIVNPPSAGTASLTDEYWGGCTTCTGVQITTGGNTYISVSGSVSANNGVLQANGQAVNLFDLGDPQAQQFPFTVIINCP